MYLGLDLSTQSLTALVIDQNGQTICNHTVNFGERLPHYNSPSGFYQGTKEGEVFANPLMWLEALDLVLSEIKDKTDLSQVKAIAGSGQQHASVYLKDNFVSTLQSLDTKSSLIDQIKPCLSREVSPIWMDHSTSPECAEITKTVGREAILSKSGSIAIERFTGAQIRKFSKTQAADYADTATIHLASSFLCSVLVADNAAIDFGDGAGMNLMNLADLSWDSELVQATASDLDKKLPGLVASDSQAGTISKYFSEKYGFNSELAVYVFSGDNPNSLIGCGASLPGTAIVSLGTSDTLFAAMTKPVTDPAGFGHVFGNPAGGYMSLICFLNGSLMREKVRDHFEIDWDQFSKAIESDYSEVHLPYLNKELTPFCEASKASLDALDAASSCDIARGFVRGQFLNMLVHSEWLGEEFNEIILTGGASQNDAIAQLIADTSGAKIKRLESASSATLGAALRALQAHENVAWKDINQMVKFSGALEPRQDLDQAGLAQFKALLSAHIG